MDIFYLVFGIISVIVVVRCIYEQSILEDRLRSNRLKHLWSEYRLRATEEFIEDVKSLPKTDGKKPTLTIIRGGKDGDKI